MRKYFFIGLGCATGFFLFFLVLFGVSYCSTRNMDRVEDDFELYESKPQIQYFEVTTRKGTFTLHTEMPKDSVMHILGKPDKTNVMSLGTSVRENYDFKKNGYDFVRIEFENGVLKSVFDL